MRVYLFLIGNLDTFSNWERAIMMNFRIVMPMLRAEPPALNSLIPPCFSSLRNRKYRRFPTSFILSFRPSARTSLFSTWRSLETQDPDVELGSLSATDILAYLERSKSGTRSAAQSRNKKFNLHRWTFGASRAMFFFKIHIQIIFIFRPWTILG